MTGQLEGRLPSCPVILDLTIQSILDWTAQCRWVKNRPPSCTAGKFRTLDVGLVGGILFRTLGVGLVGGILPDQSKYDLDTPVMGHSR